MGSFWMMLPVVFLVTGMVFYVLWRIFAIFSISPSKWILLLIALLFSGCAMFTIWYGGENLFLTISGTVFCWLFVLSFLLFLFLGVEHIISHWYKINPWIVVGVFICVLGLGNFFSLHTKVLDLEIHSDKLERDLNILLVSDIHADYIFSTYHLKTIGKLIEEKHPDIVLIAGDLLNRPHMGYVDAYRYFRDHDFGVPIYAIMGNHDVLGSTDIYSKISEISPIHFLDNESVIVDGIQLVGIIDKSIWGNGDLQNNLEATNMDKSGEFYTIFLTHQPMALEKIKDYPIDLEVAGHTHRGQFYGFRKLVEVMNDYGYGKFEEDGKIAFVTQGIGTWGLPFRLGTQSEAVMIHLKK